MANRPAHKPYPEGRRLAAPPRRLPPAANDNVPPVGLRLKRAAFVLALLAMAASVVMYS